MGDNENKDLESTIWQNEQPFWQEQAAEAARCRAEDAYAAARSRAEQERQRRLNDDDKASYHAKRDSPATGLGCFPLLLIVFFILLQMVAQRLGRF